MTDKTIDMAPFLARHDRMTRNSYLVILPVSLALSAIIAFADTPGESITGWWMQVIWPPLAIASLWIAGWMYGRTRPPARPDGRFPMTADDARGAERVANAGAVFVIGFGLVMVAIQMFAALRIFGFLQFTAAGEDLGFRAVLVAVGGLMAYFGNAGPRMPTPRAPEAKPAVRMKYNRFSSWVTVIAGVLLASAALFLPADKLVDGVGGLSILLLIVQGAGTVVYHRALKSPTTR